MAKTNSGLVEYCKAQVGKPYWFGTFGQTASAGLYAEKKKQYPNYYTASDFSSQYGKRVHDCAGLIKGYLWSATPTSAPKYNASQDYGATTFYATCTKKGAIGSFDRVEGRLVFRGSGQSMSHMGVYIGDDTVIEAKGHAYGVIKSKFTGGGWTNWGQCKFIDEDPEPVPVPTEPVTVQLDVLAKGMRSGQVQTIQMLLNEIGFRDQDGKRLATDGAFGDRTKYALTNYQKARGLTVTGICDFETWNRILK